MVVLLEREMRTSVHACSMGRVTGHGLCITIQLVHHLHENCHISVINDIPMQVMVKTDVVGLVPNDYVLQYVVKNIVGY